MLFGRKWSSLHLRFTERRLSQRDSSDSPTQGDPRPGLGVGFVFFSMQSTSVGLGRTTTSSIPPHELAFEMRPEKQAQVSPLLPAMATLQAALLPAPMRLN